MRTHRVIRLILSLASSLILGGLLAVEGVQPSVILAAGRPAARVVPHNVPIGGRATVIGAHFGSDRYVTLLLYVRASKPIERFLGTFRTDTSGNVRAQVHMPLITHCGTGIVDVLTTQSSIAAAATFVLTGCTASKGAVPPPPPPAPSHKKKP